MHPTYCLLSLVKHDPVIPHVLKLTCKWHELDEAHSYMSVSCEVDKLEQLSVIETFHDDDIQLDAVKPGS